MTLRGQVPHFSWRPLGCQSGGQCHQVSQSVQIPLALSVTQAVVSQLVLSSGGCRVESLCSASGIFVPIFTFPTVRSSQFLVALGSANPAGRVTATQVLVSAGSLRVDTAWSSCSSCTLSSYLWCHGWDGGWTLGALVLFRTVAGLAHSFYFPHAEEQFIQGLRLPVRFFVPFFLGYSTFLVFQWRRSCVSLRW